MSHPQLTTIILLLLTRSFLTFASLRPSQSVSSPLDHLLVTRWSAELLQSTLANSSQETFSDIMSNKSDSFSKVTSGEEDVGSTEQKQFCVNCSSPWKKRTFPKHSMWKHNSDYNPADWQSDGIGVLPFYRVRSDLNRSPAKVVTILGLFELSTNPKGRSELAAAQLAIRNVNQRRLLGDYQLRMITNDTKVLCLSILSQ